MDTPAATHRSDPGRGKIVASAAEVYESFFVPALFGQWVPQTLEIVGHHQGCDLLDVGCGTGIVARSAKRRAPRAVVAGVDPNPAMLDVARAEEPAVDWQVGAAEALPFDDDRFDGTASQFAAMFFDDPRLAVDEMVRVTRPGGRVAIATWAAIEHSPGYAAMVELLAEEVGQWAADALLAPFTIGDDAAMDDLLPHPGDHSIETRPGTARFESIDAWLHTDVRGWTLADRVDDDQFDALLVAARERLAGFVGPDGAVTFSAPAIYGVIDVR